MTTYEFEVLDNKILSASKLTTVSNDFTPSIVCQDDVYKFTVTSFNIILALMTVSSVLNTLFKTRLDRESVSQTIRMFDYRPVNPNRSTVVDSLKSQTFSLN